ncbi:DNA replication complex subunit Gins51 [Halococcus sp. AFM35]|uniref:DNA replication complex subunit Gins51 n=1 Tax=Halococcus sp. AFM35 TaxID=3421653 RepID=UPI003EBA3BF9
MNLGDLQSTRSKERQKDSLQHLREEFYTDVGAFVAELRTERERAAEAADDPFDAPEVRRLTDDIETAEDTVEAIYERRVGKLVKLASLAAAGMPADKDGLTSEERELFGTLVDAIESNRAHVLDDVLVGGGHATDEPVETDEPAATTEPAATAADTADHGVAHGGGDAPSTAATEPPTAPESVEPEGADGTSGRESPPEAEGGVSAADVMGGETPESTGEPTDAPPQAPPDAADASNADDDGDSRRETERTTVRITRDVGEILGADERTYQLASEDVVTLPDVNATPLLERDAAKRLD